MIRVVHPEPRIWILTFYPSRIPGSKRHRIPDPQHCNTGIVSRDEYLFKVLKKELDAALRKPCTNLKTVAKAACVSKNYSENLLLGMNSLPPIR
jgi:hypothetical protein